MANLTIRNPELRDWYTKMAAAREMAVGELVEEVLVEYRETVLAQAAAMRTKPGRGVEMPVEEPFAPPQTSDDTRMPNTASVPPSVPGPTEIF